MILPSLPFEITDQIALQKSIVLAYLATRYPLALDEFVEGLPADAQKVAGIFGRQGLVCVSIIDQHFAAHHLALC